MPDQPDSSSPLEQWIIGSRNGDDESLNRLAEYLLPKAFEFANRKMQNLSPVDDYEDVAVSAVKSVCQRFRHGEKEFFGENELEGLLRQFVIGKIRGRWKYHNAEKRNVNLNISEGSVVDEPFGDRKLQARAFEEAKSIWLDDQSISLPVQEQAYLESTLHLLGSDVQGLFAELVKRLDNNPRKLLMLMTTASLSNAQLAEAMDCAPASIVRYRKAIRRKLEEIVNE